MLVGTCILSVHLVCAMQCNGSSSLVHCIPGESSPERIVECPSSVGWPVATGGGGSKLLEAIPVKGGIQVYCTPLFSFWLIQLVSSQ